MADHSEIRRAVRLSVEHVERLARTLYRAMATAYRDSLLTLGFRYGVLQKRVALSAAIRGALADEARRIAAAAVETYNRLVQRFLDRNGDRPTNQVVPALAHYMRERGRKRSPMIVRSAVHPAKLDAIVGFYRENGLEPEFDFRGNEGPPSCLTCTELVRTSPHELDLVIAIGYPHPGCSHGWHVKGVRRSQLQGGARPGRISLGRGETGGVLGTTPLLMRVHGQEQAVAEIRRLKVGTRSP